MEAELKKEMAENTAGRIYNHLCEHYNAQDIAVPISIFNMIFQNTASLVQKVSAVYVEELKELAEMLDNN